MESSRKIKMKRIIKKIEKKYVLLESRERKSQKAVSNHKISSFMDCLKFSSWDIFLENALGVKNTFRNTFVDRYVHMHIASQERKFV